MYGAVRVSRVSLTAYGRGAILLSVLTVALAAAVPLLSGWYSRPEIVTGGLEPMVPDIAGAADEAAVGLQMPAQTRGIDVWDLLCRVYLAGVCLSVLRLAVTVGRIAVIAFRSERCGRLLLSADDSLGPFSWGGLIFMSHADYETDGEMLMAHETAHRDAAHWADLLVVNLLGCVAWYCPVTGAIRRELQSTHEYAADRAVLDAGFDPREYQMLLIAKASGRGPAGSIADCINNHSLKSRIIMMQRKSPARHQRLRCLVLVPVGLTVCALASIPALAARASSFMPAKVTVAAPVAQETVAEKPISNSIAHEPAMAMTEPVATTEANAKVKSDTDAKTIAENEGVADAKSKRIFDVVEQPPQYPGGMTELMKYLMSGIRYPKECAERNITGRVVVRFVVTADGSIGDVKVVRGVDPQLDGEAVRLVRGLPAFEPGKLNGEPVNCWFTLPVVFRLTGDKTPKNVARYDRNENGSGSVSHETVIEKNGREIYRTVTTDSLPRTVVRETEYDPAANVVTERVVVESKGYKRSHTVTTDLSAKADRERTARE